MLPFGTLTTISESPAQFGFLYTGSDDGYAYRSENGGGSWDRISDELPQNLWVSRIVASEHQKERVYITLNGYRDDDFKPYVYVSENKGDVWRSINANLPNSPINVIREDPNNDQILYLGNDQGTYISFDQGERWSEFKNGVTTAAVHDLVIQPEANHLLIGTHGRSIYKTDLAPFNKVNANFLKQELILLDLQKVKHSSRWGTRRSSWRNINGPQITLSAYALSAGSYEMQVKNKKGIVLFEQKGMLDTGFNFVIYALEKDANGIVNFNKKNKKSPSKSSDNGKHYLEKGTYSVEFTKGSFKSKKELHIH